MLGSKGNTLSGTLVRSDWRVPHYSCAKPPVIAASRLAGTGRMTS